MNESDKWLWCGVFNRTKACAQQTLSQILFCPTNIMWSVSHISSTLPTEVWQSLFSNDDLLLSIYLSWLPVTIAYITIHYIFSKFVAAYNNLSSDSQTVVIHHAIESVVLLLCFIPMTYLTMSILFEEQTLPDLKSKFIPLITIISTIIITYLLELASRHRNPRPILILHHLVTYFDASFVLVFQSTAIIKVALVLTYFITFEAMTFVGLLCYRLFPLNRFTPNIILAGMILMAASRPFQIILIFGFLFSAWSDLVLWHAIVQMVVTIILTAIQIWSLSIHYGLWKKSLAKQGREIRLPFLFSWPLLLFSKKSRRVGSTMTTDEEEGRVGQGENEEKDNNNMMGTKNNMVKQDSLSTTKTQSSSSLVEIK